MRSCITILRLTANSGFAARLKKSASPLEKFSGEADLSARIGRQRLVRDKITRPSGAIVVRTPDAGFPAASDGAMDCVGESIRTLESRRIGPSDDIQKSVVWSDRSSMTLSAVQAGGGGGGAGGATGGVGAVSQVNNVCPASHCVGSQLLWASMLPAVLSGCTACACMA